MFRKPRFQREIERAIRYERNPEDNGKPILIVDANKLEIEIFVKLKGAEGEPKSIGTYPVSEIDIGKD